MPGQFNETTNGKTAVITFIAPVKTERDQHGENHPEALRAELRLIQERVPMRETEFDMVPQLFFLTLSVVDIGGKPYFIFTTMLYGEVSDYVLQTLQNFRKKIHSVWRHCEGYPFTKKQFESLGADDSLDKKFLAFVGQYARPANVFHAQINDLSPEEINVNRADAAHVTALADFLRRVVR